MSNLPQEESLNHHSGEIAVIGIFPNREAAEEILHCLTNSGFSPEYLAILGSEEVGGGAAAGHLGLPASLERGQRKQDRTWGTLSGALLGLLLGAEVAALAGLAGFAAVGALAAVAATSAATGAIYGEGQADLDISEEATFLREEIQAGRVLVAAHAHQSLEATRARDVFDAGGALLLREYPFLASKPGSILRNDHT